jgi:hypothetical protein
VIERKGNTVKLIWQDYAPKLDIFEGLQMIAEDSSDLVRAIDENVREVQEEPNLHLKTEFTSIEDKKLPEIRRWLLQEGSQFHKRVRDYLSEADADLNPTLDPEACTTRVAYGSFSITEEANQ